MKDINLVQEINEIDNTFVFTILIYIIVIFIFWEVLHENRD